MSEITEIILEVVREKLSEEVHDHGNEYTSEIQKTPHGVISHVYHKEKPVGHVIMPKHLKGKVYRATHGKTKVSANTADLDKAIKHIVNNHEKHIFDQMYIKTFPKKEKVEPKKK